MKCNQGIPNRSSARSAAIFVPLLLAVSLFSANTAATSQTSNKDATQAQSPHGPVAATATATTHGVANQVLNPPGRHADTHSDRHTHQDFMTWKLESVKGEPFNPTAIVIRGDDLYLLDSTNVWIIPSGKQLLSSPRKLVGIPSSPLGAKVTNIPIQEFSNLVSLPVRSSLAILDKSGDILELGSDSKRWKVLRPNNADSAGPHPEYIDMASIGNAVCLLDPERNQIWRWPQDGGSTYFKEVLPWRVKPGDITVADGISIAVDGDKTYVLRKSGRISCYQAANNRGPARPVPFSHQSWHNPRPSRLFSANGGPLFVVERENNRVVAIDKKSGAIAQFLFPGDSDLRGMIPAPHGFWVIDGSNLVFRSLKKSDPAGAKCSPRRIDDRLAGLTMPIKGAILPRHPGVWPGARRLYRHGVHKGTDFFADAGPIRMGTPVYAADAGKVIRADGNFKDMNAAVYSAVIGQCRREHISSERNEDLLRGCQVWIDHGNGLVTKYAHLDKIRAGLKSGMKVGRGELVGYVGVSGTGENLPGRVKHPHLHFEIWLDNKYLGSGLTPAETIGVLEDIFGASGKRGSS